MVDGMTVRFREYSDTEDDPAGRRAACQGEGVGDVAGYER
jgi:hypothetical protein